MGWGWSLVEEHVPPMHKAVFHPQHQGLGRFRGQTTPQADYPVISVVMRLPQMADIGR